MQLLKKSRLLLVIGLAGAILSGCGARVTINSGEVGKMITTSGLEEEIRQPGSFRMDPCPVSACPKLVRLQSAVSAQTVTIEKVFLPKSNVALDNVEFGIQFRIKPDKASVNQAFDDIRSEATGTDRFISSGEIFATYIARKAPEAVIAALREYTVEEALSEPDIIAEFAKKRVNEALAGTPVTVTEFGFPNGAGTPPKVVLDAKDALYAIEEEKAREIKALEAALEIEDQRQAVARKRALNDKEIASKLGISVSVYQCLRAMDTFADASASGATLAFAGDCLSSRSR